MHYANGRVAKNGDRVIRIPANDYGKPIIGILHDAIVGNDTCNGSLAIPNANDPMVNLQECLHLDNLKAALGDIKKVKDTSE